jgi:hypothetical protein
MRQVAELGGFNLASGHYHYGSKRDLYLEVLRAQFASVRNELARRGAEISSAELKTLSPVKAEKALHTRIKTMLDIVVGPPPSAHGALMQREFLDPSEALPVVVDEFISPMTDDLAQIVRRCQPGLDDAEIERCAYSIVGQVLFYRVTMPALLYLTHRRQYPKNFTDSLSAHILAFSLGGLERVALRKGRKRRGR